MCFFAIDFKPGTFSKTKNFGRISRMTRIYSKSATPLLSSNPFLNPAVENDWQGGPPMITSTLFFSKQSQKKLLNSTMILGIEKSLDNITKWRRGLIEDSFLRLLNSKEIL